VTWVGLAKGTRHEYAQVLPQPYWNFPVASRVGALEHCKFRRMLTVGLGN